jgi:hypothetical protein
MSTSVLVDAEPKGSVMVSPSKLPRELRNEIIAAINEEVNSNNEHDSD